MTGRLATIEEVVDWQPYDHVGYRLAVPDIGPMEVTYDLEADQEGTALVVRWAAVGAEPSGAEPSAGRTIDRLRRAKIAGIRRLGALLTSPDGGMPAARAVPASM